MGFLTGYVIISRIKVGEILNFESFFSLKMNLKFKIVFFRIDFIIRVMFTLGSIK